jgi:hypothetical protein
MSVHKDHRYAVPYIRETSVHGSLTQISQGLRRSPKKIIGPMIERTVIAVEMDRVVQARGRSSLSDRPLSDDGGFQ